MKRIAIVLTALVLVVTMSIATYTQSGISLIHDFPAATLRGYWNEMALDEKPGVADPVKFRMGAWQSAGTSYLGVISGDRLEGDPANPTRREKCFIAMKIDPDPVIEFYCQRTASTTEDRDMIRIARFSAKEIEFTPPIKGATVSNTVRVGDMWSTDGHYVTQQQDDGNFVSYYLEHPFDKSQFRPLWSAWTGRIN